MGCHQLGAHAYRMLIDVCNTMLCPNHVVRSSTAPQIISAGDQVLRSFRFKGLLLFFYLLSTRFSPPCCSRPMVLSRRRPGPLEARRIQGNTHPPHRTSIAILASCLATFSFSRSSAPQLRNYTDSLSWFSNGANSVRLRPAGRVSNAPVQLEHAGDRGSNDGWPRTLYSCRRARSGSTMVPA